MQNTERERDELADRLANTSAERESFAQLADELQAELDAVTQAAVVERDSLNGAISSVSDENASLAQQLQQARGRIADLETSLRCAPAPTALHGRRGEACWGCTAVCLRGSLSLGVLDEDAPVGFPKDALFKHRTAIAIRAQPRAGSSRL